HFPTTTRPAPSTRSSPRSGSSWSPGRSATATPNGPAACWSSSASASTAPTTPAPTPPPSEPTSTPTAAASVGRAPSETPEASTASAELPVGGGGASERQLPAATVGVPNAGLDDHALLHDTPAVGARH